MRTFVRLHFILKRYCPRHGSVSFLNEISFYFPLPIVVLLISSSPRSNTPAPFVQRWEFRYTRKKRTNHHLNSRASMT